MITTPPALLGAAVAALGSRAHPSSSPPSLPASVPPRSPASASPSLAVPVGVPAPRRRRRRPRPSAAASRRAFVASSSALASLPLLDLARPSSASALDPTETASSYDAYASDYDDLDGGPVASLLGIDDARRALLGRARGRVLEVGAGTGLSLNSYDFGGGGAGGGVTSLTMVDISGGMLDRAAARVREMKQSGAMGEDVAVAFVKADATSELIATFGKNQFDTVIDTFGLCVMGNEGARRCLEQMEGVVKGGGGQILLLENSRASNPLLGYYQDITAPAAADMGGKAGLAVVVALASSQLQLSSHSVSPSLYIESRTANETGTGCVYNQDVGAMISGTEGLKLMNEEKYAAGLFRSFVCRKT
ncbi:hypothetical protein ACHAWF_016362 [Thalassiosira exigua]